MKIKEISLSQIDLEDERFRICRFFQTKKLLLSIKKIGLVSPLITTTREGRILLVAGWKRASVCGMLSIPSVPVLELQEKDDRKVFLYSVYENLSFREFSILEKAEILSRLKKFGMDDKTIVRDFHSLLGIPPTLSYYDIFLGLSNLEREWKRAIHEKNIPLEVVQLLLEFSASERKSLLPLLSPLNRNKQKQMLEDLSDLKGKEQISVSEILGWKDVRAVFRNERLSSLQKAERVHILLRNTRYPTLVRWRETFQTTLKKYRLSQAASMSPSSFFEDGEFLVKFSLKRNQKECQKKLNQLRKLMSDENLVTLFKDFPDG